MECRIIRRKAADQNDAVDLRRVAVWHRAMRVPAVGAGGPLMAWRLLEFFAADDGGVNRVAVMETGFPSAFLRPVCVWRFPIFLPLLAVLRQFIAFRRRQRRAFFRKHWRNTLTKSSPPKSVVARADTLTTPSK